MPGQVRHVCAPSITAPDGAAPAEAAGTEAEYRHQSAAGGRNQKDDGAKISDEACVAGRRGSNVCYAWLLWPRHPTYHDADHTDADYSGAADKDRLDGASAGAWLATRCTREAGVGEQHVTNGLVIIGRKLGHSKSSDTSCEPAADEGWSCGAYA